MQNIPRMMKLGLRAFSSNFNALKYPYKLTFAITYWCNSRCKHCFIWQKRPQNELTLEEIREFAKNSPFFSWYNLTGGEPFLRSDIVDIIQAFWENSNNFYVLNTTTNSFNPDLIVDRIQEILEFKIPRVIVTLSLDGYKELHENIRGIPGGYEKVINLYKKLMSIRKEHKNLNVFFGYTSMPLNMGQFKKTILEVKKDIPDIKTTDFHVNLFHYSGHYYDNLENNYDMNEYNKKVLKELDFVSKIRPLNLLNPISFLEHNYVKYAKWFVKTGKTPLPCKALQTSFFLDSWGNIFPCIIYDKNIGNIRNFGYDAKKVLASKEVDKLKKEIMMLKCPNCWTPCEAYQIILGNLINL